MSRTPSSAGFTLIEVIVVIAIVATLLGAAVVGVGALTGARARATLGELGATVRAMYDRAALTGHTCRMVFDLPAGDTTGFSYRAECASRALTSAVDRDQTLKDDNLARLDAAEANTSQSGQLPRCWTCWRRRRTAWRRRPSSPPSPRPEVEPRRVTGVKLSVWTPHQRQPARSGLAYLYFFPQGAVERAQLTARQGNSVWTLTVSPLTGKTTVVDGEPEIPKS